MYTIVIVDDEEELRRAIINRIDWDAVGFRIVGEADNGIEALDLVEKMEPDLLMTDIRMPFLSGLELARQVREIRPATQIVFLSGYDEFAYAQQAIRYNIISYLLKPITMADLTRELQAIKAKMDGLFAGFDEKQTELMDLSEFVMPLLLDGHQTGHGEGWEEQLLKQAVFCGLVRNKELPPWYVVMTTIIRDKDGKNCTTRESVHSLDAFIKKYMSGFSFYSNGRIVSLLTASRGTFDKHLHILVGDITQSVERILGMQAFIGISRSTGLLSGCHEAYREAMDAVSYSAEAVGGVHYISDEERSSEIDMEQTLGFIKEIEKLMRGGTVEELTQYLTQMFEILRDEGVSQAMVKFLLVQLFSAVTQVVYAVADGDRLKELQENADMHKMTAFDGTIGEAKEQVIRFCLAAKELIASQRKKSSKILCEQALQIIANDFSNPDLSLIEVSRRISVSPNYLSALIKKDQSKTFIDLLTGRRIEEARQLLLCTPMKVREIAERCGYKDQHYFSYCFKKYTGYSPNAMRQKNQSEGTADA